MYDIKNIALELDVSKQTIYNHLKKQKKAMTGHIFKNKGVTFIDDEGLKQLKISLGIIQVPTVQQDDIQLEDIIQSIKESLLEEINSNDLQLKEDYESKLNDVENGLKEQIGKLKKQNDEIKNLQNEKLEYMKTEMNQEMEKLKEQNEKLLEGITELTNQNKRGFFAKLFNK